MVMCILYIVLYNSPQFPDLSQYCYSLQYIILILITIYHYYSTLFLFFITIYHYYSTLFLFFITIYHYYSTLFLYYIALQHSPTLCI